MFRILVDTSVWLDLAHPKHEALLAVLEDVLNVGAASLIVPRTVLDEFARNRNRVAKEGSRTISEAFKRVKEAVWYLEQPKRRRKLFDQLSELDHQLPTVGEAAVRTIDRIDGLLRRAEPIEASDDVKLRAAQRAIDCRAPFHRSRNSIGDAILVETYADCTREPSRGERFAFVTHNTKDFSQAAGDERLPHPDIAPLFSKIRSRYFVNLSHALKTVAPQFVSEMMIEREKTHDSRSAAEIHHAITELMDKIWYNRHQVLLERIADGDVRVVEKEMYPRKYGLGQETAQRDSLAGAAKSAVRVEKRYGVENLGPWSDFEWGMLNGKLSTLRWVLGDEWDVLDI
jgi:predicted nucleic acid-binding protein